MIKPVKNCVQIGYRTVTGIDNSTNLYLKQTLCYLAQ